jgi:linoleoyl-CoA desaturase
MNFKTVSFVNNNDEFYRTLKKRVNDYFTSRNISKKGNTKMVIKTLAMFSMYAVPYALMLTLDLGILWTFALWSAMGVGMAGLGLSVMHDANHGAYSKHEKVNKWVGYVIFFLGGSDVNWRIQHNVLHHTYTNVSGMDEDINPGAILRFSPHEKRRYLHRFQHFYAWFLYGLMTLMWFLTKDYKQAARYNKMGLIQTQKMTLAKHLTVVIATKLMYAFIMLFVPIYFGKIDWWVVLVGFVIMNFIAGFILSCIFQPAHVVPTSDYPLPGESGNIEADWAVNQLYNTANFAPKAKLFSWYVGGLNYQVEHHLFPNICHVHYSKISEIVRETAKEFNLPYHSYKSFFEALSEHTRMLKNLGKFDNAPAIHA